MAEAARQGDKLNVFISYSRDDLGFADQLDAALGLAAAGNAKALETAKEAGASLAIVAGLLGDMG